MNAAIKWMTEHPVAAWLVMAIVVAGGILAASTMRQKTYPEFALDSVAISVDYN